MYTAANTTYNFDTPLCSTGDCQWPTFGSLAHRNNAAGRTLRPTSCSLGIGDPSGNLANSSNIWLSTSDNTGWSEVYSFSNESFADNALNAVQVVYLDSSDETYYNASQGLPNSTVLLQHSRAVEVLFYLCAQTYDVSTTNGTAVTKINTTLNTVNDTQNVLVTSDNIHYTPYTNYPFILDGQNYSYYAINFNMGEMINYFATGYYNYDVINGGLDVMTPFNYAVGNILYHNTNINRNSSVGRDG
ncbi:hypothetical protein UA08_09377 [Talaromyces atroroseus]|uniref:Uncharacterized protein n=1 Tax=Talaromyces atroroseus TaxID=1441469 RepID=A0A1Q5Q6B6_TALAT|nr:hypothetical protein UA08_09377 [Talaromyces atroroseus]OKL55372.1 hypothetical protein UA08_09377 [Talaromyces atroroseus]